LPVQRALGLRTDTLQLAKNRATRQSDSLVTKNANPLCAVTRLKTAEGRITLWLLTIFRRQHARTIHEIWERETPDERGDVRRRMTATVAITNPVTKEEQTLQFFSGSVITLGEDRYTVVNVEEGARRGLIALRMIARQ